MARDREGKERERGIMRSVSGTGKKIKRERDHKRRQWQGGAFSRGIRREPFSEVSVAVLWLSGRLCSGLFFKSSTSASVLQRITIRNCTFLVVTGDGKRTLAARFVVYVTWQHSFSVLQEKLSFLQTQFCLIYLRKRKEYMTYVSFYLE